MNLKLVFQLSLFGLAMAFATVFFIPPNVEPLCWLVIFLVCAYIIGVRQTPRPFLHGLATGIVNSVWITSAHVAFYARYIAGHPREAAMAQNTPMSPRLMMALVGPLVGIVSGVVLGLFALVATRVVRARAAGAQSMS
jgi:hypothetical protein